MNMEHEIKAQLKRIDIKFQVCGLPPQMWGGVKRYLESGIPPGHFLTAVITNNLSEAVSRADDQNVNLLPNYVRFFYNEVPGGCWGSRSKYDAWIKRGGFTGGGT